MPPFLSEKVFKDVLLLYQKITKCQSKRQDYLAGKITTYGVVTIRALTLAVFSAFPSLRTLLRHVLSLHACISHHWRV